MKGLSWTGILVGMVAASAVAEEFDTAFKVDEETRQKIEYVVTKSGGTPNYFEGPSGTIGVGLSMPNGKQMVLYATADGEVIFSGVAMETTTGENLTRRDLEEKLPPPDFSGVVEAAQRASAIWDGVEGAETEFFVFIDPHCPYCHQTYQMFEALKAEGRKFQVHWIPVGLLSAKSQNSAKSLLGVPEESQLAELSEYMRNISGPAMTADIERGDKPHEGNLAIFRNLQFQGVPVVVTKRGEEVAVTARLPRIQDLRAAIMTQKVAMQ
jgi:hypothetical protein